MAGANVTVEYDAPFGITGYPWVTTLAGEYIETDYLRPDPSVDPAVERFDEEWRASLTNTVGLAPDLFATVQVLYLENDSNLPNFVFENLSILVSVTKAF